LEGAGAATEVPAAAEVATLIADMFTKASERIECLSTKSARKTYVEKVLGAGLTQILGAVKGRWNALDDPLKDAQDSAILIETLEELCTFLDSFYLSEYMVAAVDELNTTRLSMIEKMSDSVLHSIRQDPRRLRSESCVFSFTLAPMLQVLSRRLRPSVLEVVMIQGVGKCASWLQRYLLKQASFADEKQVALFAANCGEDLLSALTPLMSEGDLAPLQPIKDACKLLVLPVDEATQALTDLRHIIKCAPVTALDNQVDAPPPLADGTTLHRKLSEVFAAIGVKDISMEDAAAVLRKRPDQAWALAEDGTLSALQEVLPVQLGVSALQQLEIQAPLPSAAKDVLQSGAAELRNFFPGRLAGRLRSTLSAAA